MRIDEVEARVLSLREFADFLEAHGEVLPDFYISTVWCNATQYGEQSDIDDVDRYDPAPNATKRKMAECARALKPVEKVFSGDVFELHKEFGEYLDLVVYANRDIVCEKRQVGEKIVEAVPERVIAAIPEHKEPVYEYDCGSLLG